MATRSPYSIDPMAFIRGADAARNANWQDFTRSHQSHQMALQREQWSDQMDDLRFNREAQSYTAPLITNLQRAADAGVNSADFLIQQREQVLADPAFQSMPPETQMRVLDSLGNAARLRVQDLQRTGQFDDVARLTSAYNIVDPVMAIDRAGQTGDIAAILATRGLVADADGMVDIGGTRIPAAVVALGLARSQGQFSGALPDVVRYIQDAERRKQEQDALEQMQRLFGGTPVPVEGVPATPTGVPGTPGAQPQAANAVPAAGAGGTASSAAVASAFGLPTGQGLTLNQALTQPIAPPTSLPSGGNPLDGMSEADIAAAMAILLQFANSPGGLPAQGGMTATPGAAPAATPMGIQDMLTAIQRASGRTQ